MIRPLNKVSLAAGAGAAAAIAAWALHQFAGVDVPAGIEAAATVLISTVVAYAVPLSDDEQRTIVARRRSRLLKDG